MNLKLRLVVLIVLASFVVLMSHISSSKAAPSTGPVIVKVGLAAVDSEIILPLKGAEEVLDLSEATPQTLTLPGDQVIVTGANGVLFLNNIPVGTGPLALIPDIEPLSWNLRSYRGIFLITLAGGKLNLINQLSLEDYLNGVVSKEMIPGWPAAALKAQAIAARTYAISSLGKHGVSGFDLCATDHCQVYGGLGAEQPSTNDAVAQTVGEVITYKGKIAAAFFHASSGGQTKDPAAVWDKVVPYLKPVQDWDQNSPYAQWNRTLRWDELQALVAATYPKVGRLTQVIPVQLTPINSVPVNTVLNTVPVNTVLNTVLNTVPVNTVPVNTVPVNTVPVNTVPVNTVPVNTGNKAAPEVEKPKITLVGDLGEQTITAEDFRFLAGLPSSNLELGVLYGPEPYITLWWTPERKYPEATMADPEIAGVTDRLNPPWDLPDPWSWLRDKDPVKLIVRGSGWGHGVGLSQWGAKGMADAGFNAYQIIAHYYPGTAITKIENLK